MPSCGDCAARCGQVDPKYVDCGIAPLCGRVDVTLLDLAPRLTLAAYEEHQRTIGSGYEHARRYVASQSAPRRFDEFLIDYLLTPHHLIFRAALPDIAGRLRIEGERGEFGGVGKDGRCGAPFSLIQERLELLFREDVSTLFAPTDDIRLLSRRGAGFLLRFFAVHPFVDGNGRIGRLVLEAAVTQGRRFDLSGALTHGATGQQQSAYLTALERGHRYLDKGKSNKAIERLSEVLASWLRPLPDDFESEANPPQS